MPFPKDFLWGAATASYQIEGAALQYGRGECIWTRFSHTDGKVVNGDNGDVACDHYHRFMEDIQIMKQIGLKTYRFSVAWSRVLPSGTGEVNEQGLAWYSDLVDALLAAGITPYVTLYHWDLPQALQDDGDGWENPAIIEKFARYTEIVAKRLGDRVKHWITLNEPWVVSFLGNWFGNHAPGKQDLAAAYRVAHHLMLAHGASVKVLRAVVPDAQVGITLDFTHMQPATDNPADIEVASLADGQKNRWFFDAVFKGAYPADILAKVQALVDVDFSGVETANPPIDFIGINYYTRQLYVADGTLLGKTIPNPDTSIEHTAMGWEVYPQGLYDLLVRITQTYQPKAIYITENGSAFDDPAPQNGVVADPRRAAYLQAHFDAAERAIEAGVPLEGYFVWSLLDNFEWAEGYNKRFGIVHVDYKTLVRTLKESALYYKKKIKETSA